MRYFERQFVKQLNVNWYYVACIVIEGNVASVYTRTYRVYSKHHVFTVLTNGVSLFPPFGYTCQEIID